MAAPAGVVTQRHGARAGKREVEASEEGEKRLTLGPERSVCSSADTLIMDGLRKNSVLIEGLLFVG